MQDATALVRRVEFSVSCKQPIVTGFRKTNFLSIYFDQDPVFHFDDHGRLRRAFVDGYLYRTQGKTLARLTRQRNEQSTELLRYDLSDEELRSFRERLIQQLSSLLNAMQKGDSRVVRQIPDNVDVMNELQRAMVAILNCDPWLAPRIKGK